MALQVFREYRGAFELVGAFAEDKDGLNRFSYDESYIAQRDAVALSASLPLRHEPYTPNEYSGFFSGMIPEGPVRAELSMRFQIPQSDYLSMLMRLGEECVGALMFRQEGQAESKPELRPLTEDEIVQLGKSEVAEIANAMQSSRLSLAGAQSKTGWFLPRGTDARLAGAGQWMVPMGSAPSTHIVKVASGKHPDLPINEQICMDVAQHAGLAVAGSHASEAIDGVFISERYDRLWLDDMTAENGEAVFPARLHQEDFCQALGWSPYMKYENRPDTCYMAMCGRLIRGQSSNAIADSLAFGRQVALDYLLGNCDSHLKNHSFLFDLDWHSKRLAPAYDIVCTTVLGYDRNLGIDIGDHRAIDAVSAEDFEYVAGDLNIPLKRYRQICGEVANHADSRLHELVGAAGDLGRIAAEIRSDSFERLKVLQRFATNA